MSATAASSCSILACQVTVPVTRNQQQRREHVRRLVKNIERQLDVHAKKSSGSSDNECEGDRIDVVVLPELCTAEYSRESFDQLAEVGETLTGDTVSCFRTLAMTRNISVLFGMPRMEYCDEPQTTATATSKHAANDQKKTFYISQVLVQPDGNVRCYDKVHMCQYGAGMEKDYFQRGNHLLSFTTAKGFRFGVIICYDIRIPEQCRELTLRHQVCFRLSRLSLMDFCCCCCCCCCSVDCFVNPSA